MQGALFSFAAFVAIGVWLAVTVTRHPERRIEALVRAVFAAYIVVVLMVTMFPIPLHGTRPPPGTRIDLVPFRGLFTSGNISRVQALPNILLGVPFGLGLFFVVPHIGRWRVLGLGAAFFLGVEATQVLLTIVFPAAPRTGAIDDLMLNTVGVAIGIWLFGVMAESLRRRDADGRLDDSDLSAFIREVIAPVG